MRYNKLKFFLQLRDYIDTIIVTGCNNALTSDVTYDVILSSVRSLLAFDLI